MATQILPKREIMKYIVNTLKYIRSNPMLWVAYAVAAICFLAVVDVWSVHDVLMSYSNGTFGANLSDWIFLFLPLNTSTWWSPVISLAAYVVLTFDLTFICSSTDRHMRYNSLSPRGIFSSLNNSIAPCIIIMLILTVFNCINAVLLAGIMMATSYSTVRFMFILGIIICAALSLAEFYFLTFFSLWLPCFNITGFRAFESLSYAYSLGSERRKSLFLAIFIPAIIIAACTLPFIFISVSVISLIVISLLLALLFVYIAALVYVVYLDADGIAREDLKKF